MATERAGYVLSSLKCNGRIDTVKYNLQRHYESMHADTKEWSDEKWKLFVQQAKQKAETNAVMSFRHLSRASYCTLILVKHLKWKAKYKNFDAGCGFPPKIRRATARQAHTVLKLARVAWSLLSLCL